MRIGCLLTFPYAFECELVILEKGMPLYLLHPIPPEPLRPFGQEGTNQVFGFFRYLNVIGERQ